MIILLVALNVFWPNALQHGARKSALLTSRMRVNKRRIEEP